MRKISSLSISVALTFLTIILLVPTAIAKVQDSQGQILHAVDRVWRAKGANAMGIAAEHLRNTILVTDPKAIDDRTIHAIASLLEIQNEGIRYWVVESLGHFGPHAKFVSPKLLNILKKRECVIAETSSVPMIRDTLERIGTPAPERKCDHFVLPE